MLGATIQSEVLNSSVIKEYLHDIHQLSKLREDQDFVVSCNQLWKDSVQKLKLSTGPKDIVPHVTWLKIVQEKIGMITNLSELHHSVTEGQAS